MDLEIMNHAVKLLKQYDLEKIYVESDNFKFEIVDKKHCSSNLEYNNEKNTNSKQKEMPSNNEFIIKSPLIGTICKLNNEETGKEYSVGDKVKEDQVLCIIEAMKMLNEVISSEEGIITEIFITENQFVEYEQPLFKIRRKA